MGVPLAIRGRLRALLFALMLVVVGSLPATALAGTVRQASATTGDAVTLTTISPAGTPARTAAGGQQLTAAQAEQIANGSGAVKNWIAGHPITRITPEYDATDRQWTVWYVSTGAKGVETTQAQVFIDDATGKITETRTGPQVDWMMARGYWGAFGRHINNPWIWSGLCALFVIPLLDIRRIISWRTLDLLVLLSFSVSLIWFNAGQIFTSVPLTYPPLVYLALRMALIGTRRARRRRTAPADPQTPPEPPAPRPAFRGWAPTWVLIGVLMLTLGIRYSLNAFDSNVIDVGYAGVIGAHQIVAGVTPYGTFPASCGHCDTYGPAAYLAYVPFEVAAPWHGTWDSLPAAHAASTTFDVICLVGLLTLGWRLGGFRLGVALATAWAAYPFTAYALESNTNDALVAACLIWGLVLAARPMGRGVMIGLAVATKFTPAVLLPLWWQHPFPRGGRRRGWLWYLAGIATAVVATGWIVLLGGVDGIHTFWTRTISYQLGRQTPFSIWGQYPGLRPLQLALIALVGLAAIALVRWPRERDLLTLAGLSGALMIGLQVTLGYWFYLYIPWFLPFVLMATVPDWPRLPVRRPAPPDPVATGEAPAPQLAPT